MTDQNGAVTLCVDIGGSHIKAGLVSASGTLEGEARRVVTPVPAGPDAVVQAIAELGRALGHADRIAAGFPGVVRHGVVRTAPNLGTEAWRGTDLAGRLGDALSAPARVANDATVQGLAAVEGRGLECVITLGTGMGYALFLDGRPAPHLEMGQHIARGKKTYDEYVGEAARQKLGRKRWSRHVHRAIEQLRVLTDFDTLLIGGGNAARIEGDLPADVHVVANQDGILGGVKLWGAGVELVV